jgi:hypothetical protein
MSFREWGAAKRAKRNTKFYHEWKITWAVPTTHVSTYFYGIPHEGKYCIFNKILVRKAQISVESYLVYQSESQKKRPFTEET